MALQDEGRSGLEYNKFRETSDGGTAVATMNFSHLVPESHDYVDITNDGTNITKIEFYSGGEPAPGGTGTLVATLDITWDGTFPDTITRS